MNRTSIYHLLITACLLLGSLVMSGSVALAGKGVEVAYRFAGRTMGPIEYRVTLFANRGDSNRDFFNATIATALERVNQTMSTWIADSEVSRFNRAPADEWFPVSAETAQVVQLAQEIAVSSDGAFDVTVMPLVSLWKFGPEGKTNPGKFVPPTDQQIADVRQRVGYQHLEVQTDPPALRKTVDGLQIDLSAIAKGFAVDKVAEALEARGVKNYLVEVGGEVRVTGSASRGAWTIGIERPLADGREVLRTVKLSDAGLATSGDYRNFVQHDGKLYSHTIDPRTGRPVTHTLTSVSVIADTCVEADAAATAIMVLGPDAGRAWAESRELPILMVIREAKNVTSNDNDGLRVVAANGFNALEPKRSANPQPAQRESSSPSAISVWLITLGAFGVFIVLMAVGVLFSNRNIKGSCGGLAQFKDAQGNSICDACTKPSPDCTGVPTTTADNCGE